MKIPLGDTGELTAPALGEEDVRGISLGTRSALLLAACAAIATFLYLHGRWWPHPFFDALGYAGAITRLRQGLSPYNPLAPQPFLYPPIFALSGAWMAKLLTPAMGWKLYLLIHMLAVAAVPFILARGYLRPMGDIEAFAFYLLAPFALTMTVLIAGNIASLYYCIAPLAALPGIYRNRWRYFYPVVVLAAATKITFLVLLLLPLLAGAGQILPSMTTVAVSGGVYGLQRICLPNLYSQFRQLLSGHIFGSRDYGGALFGFTANLLKHFHLLGFAIPWAVQIIFAGVILLILLRLRRRVNPLEREWLALVILAVVLVNPRAMEYEMIVGLVPAIFLLLANSRLRLTWVLVAISVAGFFVHHGAVGQLLLSISAFIIGVRGLAATSPGRLIEI